MQNVVIEYFIVTVFHYNWSKNEFSMQSSWIVEHIYWHLHNTETLCITYYNIVWGLWCVLAATAELQLEGRWWQTHEATCRRMVNQDVVSTVWGPFKAAVVWCDIKTVTNVTCQLSAFEVAASHFRSFKQTQNTSLLEEQFCAFAKTTVYGFPHFQCLSILVILLIYFYHWRPRLK